MTSNPNMKVVDPNLIPVLKGRLLYIVQGYNWNISKSLKPESKPDKIGAVTFFREKSSLHTAWISSSRIEVTLYYKQVCAPFISRDLTYIDHEDVSFFDDDGILRTLSYWVRAVDPEQGLFYILLLDMDPASKSGKI